MNMKLDVPFYKSVNDTDCGPLGLKMALAYLGEDYSFEKLSEEERQLDTGLVWTLGIVRAAKCLGFPVKMYSVTNFSHQEDDLEYYKKYANDEGMLLLKELDNETKKLGVFVEEKNMSLDELLDFVSDSSIPIVLINWYILAKKEGFSGHFVPITGYDDEFVYIHNPGLASPQAYMPVKRDIFLKAWESKGTDKDTVIVYRKPQK